MKYGGSIGSEKNMVDFHVLGLFKVKKHNLKEKNLMR
jgi:hypothetical protein